MENQQNYNKNQMILGYLFITPTLLFLLLFSYYPAFSAIATSFTEWDGFNDKVFIGLGNYIEMFKDPIFGIAMINISKWSVGLILINLIAPLIGAELIFNLHSKRAQYWYRVLLVLPMVVPVVVIIRIWVFIYNPEIGLLNTLLESLNCEYLIHNWLGDKNFVIPSLIFVGFPWISGLYLLIYYAGLQNISIDIIESARLEGCTGFKRFRMLDLPLIRPQVELILILSIIGNLQNITLPLLMTKGGPGYASYVPSLYMYFQSFELSNFGYATAIATFMFLIILILTIISRIISKKISV